MALLTWHLYLQQRHSEAVCIPLYQLYLQCNLMPLRTSHTSNAHDLLHSEERSYDHNNVNINYKQLNSMMCLGIIRKYDRKRLLNLKVTRVITFQTLQYKHYQ